MKNRFKIKSLFREKFPGPYFRLRRIWWSMFSNRGFFLPFDIVVSIFNYIWLRGRNNSTALTFLRQFFHSSGDCVVVASGPSLNEIDPFLVNNSNVILVNKSFQAAELFVGRGNTVLSLFTDTHVYNRFNHQIAPTIPVIVVATKLNFSVSSLRSFASEGRYLYQPVKQVRFRGGRAMTTASFVRYGLFRVLYKRLKDLSDLGERQLWLNRRTVTLTAVVLAMKYGASSVLIFGFDGGAKSLNPNDAGYYSKYLDSGASRYWSWSGWDDTTRRKLDLWSRDVNLLAARHKIKLFNVSPLTSLRSIPVRTLADAKREIGKA